METKSLEKTTSRLAERYKHIPKSKDYEKKIPARALKKGMIITGIGTVVSGAALLYSLFPETVESIIEYLL